jgi:hypothetical protein
MRGSEIGKGSTKTCAHQRKGGEKHKALWGAKQASCGIVSMHTGTQGAYLARDEAQERRRTAQLRGGGGFRHERGDADDNVPCCLSIPAEVSSSNMGGSRRGCGERRGVRCGVRGAGGGGGGVCAHG